MLSTWEDRKHQWTIYEVHTHLGLSACVCPYIIPEEYSKCRPSQVQHNKDSSNKTQTVPQWLPCGMFPSQYHVMWQPDLLFNMIISLRSLACCSRFIWQHIIIARRRPLTGKPTVLICRENPHASGSSSSSPMKHWWSALSSDQIFSAPHQRRAVTFQLVLNSILASSLFPNKGGQDSMTSGSRRYLEHLAQLQNDPTQNKINFNLQLLQFQFGFDFYLCCFELFSQWWQKFLVGKMEVAAVASLPLPLPLQHSPGRLPSRSCGFAS